MSGLRIGEMCAGYGGLGAGVQMVLGGEVAWVADNDPGAAAILAHRFPSVPNYGDITQADWAGVEPVDVLCAGFPCQDVSCAGARRGLREGTRTGVWAHVARAIEALQPSIVVLENVRGLLSAGADSDMEPCPWCLGETGDERALRAAGAVCGDLASLLFDAVGTVVSAADAGAPHRRERVFILARPAADAYRSRRREVAGGAHGDEGGDAGWRAHDDNLPVGASAQRAAAARRTLEDPHRPASGERRLPAPGQETGGGPHADAGRRGGAPVAADAESHVTAGHDPLTVNRGGEAWARPGSGDRGTPADTERDGHWGHPGSSGEAHPCRPRSRPEAPGCGPDPAADAERGGRDGRSSLPERGTPERIAAAGDCGSAVRWGAYEPAIRRWEAILGRTAPSPTEPGRTGARLSPRFVEWMQGLPAGWVTDVPGLSRNAQLKALGNGVVPAQAAMAISLLLSRAFAQSDTAA